MSHFLGEKTNFISFTINLAPLLQAIFVNWTLPSLNLDKSFVANPGVLVKIENRTANSIRSSSEFTIFNKVFRHQNS